MALFRLTNMRIVSCSVKDTLNIGKAIARKLQKGDILCLFGDLGSGKTVLTKGIASGLGLKDKEVISPTFILVQRHKHAKLPLNHLDLYRLKSPREIIDLGYEEYFFGDAATVVEWADRLKYLMPKECLKIKLSVKDKTRRLLEFSACGARYKELLRQIREKI